MEPAVFVDRLAQLAPSREELLEAGLNEEEARSWIASFVCRPRRRIKTLGIETIFELFNDWDVSNITVGMIKLSELTLRSTGDFCIGTVEADPLIVAAGSGEVFVEELYSPGHRLWPVAVDASAFLDALISAAEFLSNRPSESAYLEEGERAEFRQQARRCAEAAGGDRFNDFYQMLIG
jgi:hypothetical protein